MWLKGGFVARTRSIVECPATHNRPGCAPEGGGCARRVFEAERDFRSQKGLLQEEVEALGHRVLFTSSSIVNLVLSSATGDEQNGLQEEIVGTTSKHSKQWCLKH